MSDVRPIAIAIADLHLSLTRPACRADKDWLEVQAHYLSQVTQIRKEHSGIISLPILCAGDVFDKWNPSPELINFALKNLPDKMWCVAGQHDLPNHRNDQVHRSGYGVLKETEKIDDLSDGPSSIAVGAAKVEVVYGYGWNTAIEQQKEEERYIHIAVIHKYIWVNDKKFFGAPDELHVAKYAKPLKGYDVAVFGDNHLGFLGQAGQTLVLNCGGFIRRKSDEIDYEPCVGIIYSDGTVKRKKLDTSIDKFHEDAKKREEVPIDMRAFISDLKELGEQGLNFVEVVENELRKGDYDEETRQIIWAALGK